MHAALALHSPPAPINKQLLERGGSASPARRRQAPWWQRPRLVVTAASLLTVGVILVTLLRTDGALRDLEQGFAGPCPDTLAGLVTEACPGGNLVTARPSTARLATVPDFLPAEELRALQAAVHGPGAALSPADLTAGLNALNIRLNTAGVGTLREGSMEGFALGAFHPFFERLRLPDANAWSLNVVYSQPQGVQRRGHTGPQDPHMDNLRLGAPELPPLCTIFSHQTSAFYVWIPRDMVGGNLTLMTVLEGGAVERAESVAPRENLLATFRGDLAHAVEPFDSAGMRISLTLEQYRVPKGLYWATEDFTARKLAY